MVANVVLSVPLLVYDTLDTNLRYNENCSTNCSCFHCVPLHFQIDFCDIDLASPEDI